MSTRGIISLQKGNRVRYCWVKNDSGSLATSIMEMTYEEIEATFNGMCSLDSMKLNSKKPSLGCAMSHLESDREFREWIGYAIERMKREKMTKTQLAPYANRHEVVNGQRLAGKDLYIYLRTKCLHGGQPTANLPIVYEGHSFNGDDCGSFTVSKPVVTQADAINHKKPFNGCENICYYNLDTKEIRFWAGGDLTIVGKKNKVKRRSNSIWPKISGFNLTKAEINANFKKYVG